MSNIVYTDAPEGTHWPSDHERQEITDGRMPMSHFRTVLRYDEDEGTKFWHPAVFDVKPTGMVTSRNGFNAWPVDATLAVNAELACATCGESPDYMVVYVPGLGDGGLGEGGYTSATFYCNDDL